MNKLELAYRMAWWLIALSLVTGMVAPMMTFTSFYFFNDTYSLAAGIFHLLEEDEPVLFVLVFCFSILMPAYKMYLLYRLIPVVNRLPDKRHHKQCRRLEMIGKWSMLDVFVIAILVVTIKLGTVASIEVNYGLYVFSAAVIGSMIFSQLLYSIALEVNQPEK